VLAQIRKARQEESGFTLIELLMVIVILGVLSGIVVFAVGGVTERGQTAACKADQKTVATAVEAYYAQNSSYPTGADSATRLGLLVPTWLHSAPTATVSLAAGGVVSGAGACTAVTL
jgi:prepilin-type N-terminal cleavage/methylation domain-containing protein